MIPHRNERCAHQDIQDYVHYLVLDILFITEGKKSINPINHSRLKTWSILRDKLINCQHLRFTNKDHSKVINFVDDLILRLYNEDWADDIDFDKIKEWYKIDDELQYCTEPIIHY